MSRRVAYISSPRLVSIADRLPSNLERASFVHTLHRAFNLLSDDTEDLEDRKSKAIVYSPSKATPRDLARYHLKEYVEYISFTENDEEHERPRKRQRIGDDIVERDVDDLHGLKDDCPRFKGLEEYVALIAGGSIFAAQRLRDDLSDVAIFWDGGRHHASRGEARGFCYVQDVVLAISELKRPTRIKSSKKIKKVFYLDLDIHHGDGVYEAFPPSSSSTVQFLSIHHASPGFYPAPSPPLSPSCIPIPFTLTSAILVRLFTNCLLPMLEVHNPDAIVLQCGVDGLSGDIMNNQCGDLSLSALGQCVQGALNYARANSKKILLLGGGGYNNPNAARAWTYFTSLALERPLSLNTAIPDENNQYYTSYAPDFTLDVKSSGKDISKTELEEIEKIEMKFNGWIQQVKDAIETKNKDKRTKESDQVGHH